MTPKADSPDASGIQTARGFAGVDRPGVVARRVGWVLSGLVVLFLLFDAASKVFTFPSVLEAGNRLGIAADSWPVIGSVLLVFTVLYALPRTSVFGAVFVTAYLGGAVCANVITHAPFFTVVLSPVYVAILLWLGLYLHNTALRTLVRVGH